MQKVAELRPCGAVLRFSLFSRPVMLELEQGRAEFENLRWRYFIVRIQDLIIDPRSLGEKYWLVEVSPAYEYKDNRRTDSITGDR